MLYKKIKKSLQWPYCGLGCTPEGRKHSGKFGPDYTNGGLISGTSILFGKLAPHQENAEEENNSHVVFKLYIHGSTGIMGGGEGVGLRRYSAHFHHSCWTDI
jgi:hypothetical protein